MKIAILGAGRMGSWLARALRGHHEVAVTDKDSGKTEGLEGVRILREMAEIGQFTPDLFVNAVNLEETVSAYEEVGRFLRENCILCDMASIKHGIAGYYERCGFRFVSVHPMFGPTFARMDRLEGEHAVIIKESDEEGAEFFRRFLTELGVKVFVYSFEEHDRMMSYSLTIPFISTMTFAACLTEKTVPGTTFRKHWEIAKGLLAEDDRLLSEILFNPYSLGELERITARLEFLKHVIKGRDYEEAHLFFNKLRENVDVEL